MDIVDDEASSVPESHQPEDVESTKGKWELEFLLHNVSSIDLGSDSGREFPKIDPSPVFKDHSIHGMYSSSPGFADARMSTKFSGRLRSDLRREGIAHHQNALGSPSSSYMWPLPSEFSSSNMVGLGSSLSLVMSENLYGSNSYRICDSRVNIPYDWMPSLPFSPSSYITQNLLSAVSQKKLAIEQGSALWL